MIVWLGLAMNGLLFAGAWWVAGRLVTRGGWITRTLACAVVAQTWIVVGLQLLGPAGWLAIAPLLLWSGVLFLAGWIARTLQPAERISPVDHGFPEPWRFESVISIALVLWAIAYLGMQSLLLPVKVVSDGPIYHLYFAVRWWKAGRLFLVASPFGESAATYFPANGDLWFTWLMVGWGGDRLARLGQAPFLLVAALAAYGMARNLGAGRNASLLATCWFITSSPFLLFSFEGNVDTIFVAGYLAAAYFFLVYVGHGMGPAALLLGGLAAGFSLGTKSVGLVFVPLLLLFALGAIAARETSLRKASGASLVVLSSLLVPAGFWFARNLMLTGNPLYPLRVEFLGRTLLPGWYDRGAMIFSPYYVPIENWRALGDIILAVMDPRMVPLWVASLAGVWAVGKGAKTENRRWIWALSILALLNIAFYWIFIPYRTQQRFMLQALGLATVPLAILIDRGRPLHVLAALLLTAHLLTSQAWPFATRESDIPWDLTPLIPNAVSPLIPVLARVSVVYRSDSALAAASVGLQLAMGFCTIWAAWEWSRAHAGRCRGPSIAVGGLAGLIIAAGLDANSLQFDTRYGFYPPFRDYFAGWMDLEGRSGPSGARIAYAGTNIPYYLFGTGLRNEVRYVNTDGNRRWLMHDYHGAASSRGDATWPNSRPGWDRSHPNYEGWLANLRAEDIQLLVVTRVNPEEGPHNVADADGFPIERQWADAHPESFELLYGPRQQDRLFRLYRLLPRPIRGDN